MAHLTSLARAFQTPDLRKKLLFTLGIIVVFRFGSTLPVPGISAPAVRYCSGLESGSAVVNIYAILNLFSGRYLVPSVTVFPVYYLAFFALMVAFTYFYTSITFNPGEVADNIRKYGGFVPGLRPGPPTARYLGYVLSRLTAAGAVYLAVIAMLPMIALDEIGVGSQVLFSGVSLLIMVGVGLNTVKQIESQLRQHNYGGFLRKPARPGGELAGTSGEPAALTLS